MTISIRAAIPGEESIASSILMEAAGWLESRGEPLWKPSELSPDQIQRHVSEGLFFLAEHDDVAAGTVRFQLTDPLFWPDVSQDEAAYIHRLAVRRGFAGGTISARLLKWAAARTAALGRRYLRLDCEASRPKLRAVYEQFGFRYHSDRIVGPYHVARYELAIDHSID